MTLLSQRPRVGALVVPFVVDESMDPIDFKRLDPARVEACAVDGRCAVCGGKIRRGPVAFLGPRDDFSPVGTSGPRAERNCFADPWMHPECADLAMETCPFVAGRKGWRDPDDLAVTVGAVYERNMVLVLADDWAAHRDPAGQWHFEMRSPHRERRPAEEGG